MEIRIMDLGFGWKRIFAVDINQEKKREIVSNIKCIGDEWINRFAYADELFFFDIDIKSIPRNIRFGMIRDIYQEMKQLKK